MLLIMPDPELTTATISVPGSALKSPPTMEAPFQFSQAQPLQSISFSIWPPTQRPRDAVFHRLIETLSTPSVLSQRYGTLSPDDASAAARRIEDEAFSTASASASPVNDGIEIIEFYSKEISKLVLDAAKAKVAGLPFPSHAYHVSSTESEF